MSAVCSTEGSSARVGCAEHSLHSILIPCGEHGYTGAIQSRELGSTHRDVTYLHPPAGQPRHMHVCQLCECVTHADMRACGR